MTYNPDRDEQRLKAQLDRVRGLMEDHRWRTLAQIAPVARGSEAAVSARLRDLRKPQFGSRIVERRYAGAGVWEYRLAPEGTNPGDPQLRFDL